MKVPFEHTSFWSGGSGILLILWLLSGCTRGPFQESLNGPWWFRYDPGDVGMAEGWAGQEPTGWDTVAVPGYFSDSDYDGPAWYLTRFVPPQTRTPRLALIFEAVDDNALVFLNGKEVGSHMGWGERFWIEITGVVQRGELNQLAVRIEDTGGPGGIIGDVELRAFSKEAEIAVTEYGKMKAHPSPDWLPEAVLYELFVRDFSATGDFAGVEAHLDDLKDLGVTVLWLMPIHPIGAVKRKGRLGSPYSVKNYYGINPDFGTAEDFRRLVQAVHDRGMRLILDMVPNHSAWDNPLLKEYPEWYTRNDQGETISPNADWTDVADFDYTQPALRKWMQDMLVWWLEEFDVDGFRIDVAELTPGDFWAATRAILKKVRPDVFLLAEGNRPYLHVSGFDATYAFNTFYHLIQVANGQLPPAVIHADMDMEANGYPHGSIRMRFVENHDQLRAAAAITRRDALEATTACAFFLPGIPLLYNGAEMTLEHRLELFNVDPIDWTAGSDEFREWVKEILALRRRFLPVLQTYRPVETTDARVLAFERARGKESFLAVFNFSGETVRTSLTGYQSPLPQPEYARRASVSGTAPVAITLEPWGYAFFFRP